MSEEPKPDLLDGLVDRIAKALDALGLNGGRLRWQWRRKRREWNETRARNSVMMRSAKAKHKMCRSCRALMPRDATTCPECDADMSAVRAPGTGRLLSNIFPGVTGTTSLLLLVNCVLFVLMTMNAITSGTGGGLSLLFSFPWEVSVRYGSGSGLLAFADGEWWRVITAMFLHGGLVHFGFNSMALLSLGPIMESEYGAERFWVVYLASGIVGNLAHMATSGPGVVGASGALCGLIGLLIAFGTRVRTQATAHLKSAMIRFAFIMVVISLIPGVSWKAHFAGFACGYLLGWVVPNGPSRSKAQATLWQLVSLAGVILVLYCFYEISVHGADVFERYGI